LGVEFRGAPSRQHEKAARENYDAIFVGSGAPRGRDLDIPGRKEAAKNIHIGIDCFHPSPSAIPTGSQARDRSGRRQHRHDCCRSSIRLGGEDGQGDRALGLRGNEASPGKRKTRSTRLPILITSCPRPSSTRTEN